MTLYEPNRVFDLPTPRVVEAFAPDGLTSVGGFAGVDYKGGQLFGKVDGKKMGEDFVAFPMWPKSRADCTGKIGACDATPERYNKAAAEPSDPCLSGTTVTQEWSCLQALGVR